MRQIFKVTAFNEVVLLNSNVNWQQLTVSEQLLVLEFPRLKWSWHTTRQKPHSLSSFESETPCKLPPFHSVMSRAVSCALLYVTSLTCSALWKSLSGGAAHCRPPCLAHDWLEPLQWGRWSRLLRAEGAKMKAIFYMEHFYRSKWKRESVCFPHLMIHWGFGERRDGER